MKLVYGTNTWSHHQAPVAKELARILGPDNFRMALFDALRPERRALGWSGPEDVPWVMGPPQDATATLKIARECLAADVMVVGHCPTSILQSRAAGGRLTFVASERMLRKPLHRLRLLNPRYALGMARYREMVNHPAVHALAIGRYAPADLRTIGAFADRKWRWGYFVHVPATPPAFKGDAPVKIIWAGRMLKLKRVDTLLRALARLRDSPRIGECLLVGDGPEKDSLRRRAKRLRLDSGRVRFEPPVPFGDVRKLMQTADIYVFPSGHQEGWGAVAGEAMGEGCILVANEQAGAARELVVDGTSGLLFRDGDDEQLAGHLDRLSRDHDLRGRLRQAAWERMTSLWSPRAAAERLVALSEGLLAGAPPQYVDGPCSRAG